MVIKKLPMSPLAFALALAAGELVGTKAKVPAHRL
jgi:hypothetical protein